MKYDACTDEELIERLRQGETEITDYILEKYKPLVRKYANAMYLIGGETDDLIQEGMIGLFKAIRDFCLDKDSSFFHFAGLCIHRQLYSAIEASNRKKHQPLNSYLSFFEQGAEGSIGFTSSPEQLVIEHEVSRDLWNRVNSRLSPMEKQVLQFYLDGNNYMQIAGLMKKSPKSVDNALQRIRQKIRRMKFSKIGKHTIRCVISEQEIQDLGYTIEEIMSNGERTQEFMNQIFDMAEQSFETKFELGIKTVRADFMSDHTLALTFSEHPGSDEMMEHLKDIVNGLMNAIPQQKWAQINEARQNEGNPDQVPVYATIVFADFDRLLRYAKNIMPPDLPTGQLYKYEDRYMLILTFSGMEEGSLRRLSNLTDEYAQDILVGAERKAFIQEHGICILKNDALQQLRQL